MFYCSICDLPTDSEENLTMHIKRMHTGGRKKEQYSCRACGKLFDKIESMNFHEKSCDIFRPYRCEYIILYQRNICLWILIVNRFIFNLAYFVDGTLCLINLFGTYLLCLNWVGTYLLCLNLVGTYLLVLNWVGTYLLCLNLVGNICCVLI